jgi:phosphomannomutase
MEHLFKPYDIRGVYPSEITEDFAYNIGRAIATQFPGEDIIVGRDCRIGSDKLAAAVLKGISDQGNDAVNIGICSTPMLVFAAQQAPAVMITASHNAKEYNGFKLYAKGGDQLALPDGIGTIKRLIEANAFVKPKKKGSIRKKSLLDKYVAHVRQFKGKLKKLKVVIDAGNGVQGLIVPNIFARLPVKIIPLAFECDGGFPSRNPNPLKENALVALCKAVKDNKAHLGVAFDGDGDRVVFVDEKGCAARPDHILVLLAQHALKQHPHAKVLYDVRSSRIVKEAVTKLGGVAILTRTGHAYITHIMQEEQALLAGEQSGHYYFRDNACADNGDIAALMLLNLLSEEKKPLSKLLAPLDKYFNSGELNFAVADKQQRMKEVEDDYKDKGRAHHLDGLTVEFPDWWFNLRPSTTEDVLKLNVEASSKAQLAKKVAELKRLLS